MENSKQTDFFFSENCIFVSKLQTFIVFNFEIFDLTSGLFDHNRLASIVAFLKLLILFTASLTSLATTSSLSASSNAGGSSGNAGASVASGSAGNSKSTGPGQTSQKESADRIDMPPPPSPASSTCSDTGSFTSSKLYDFSFCRSYLKLINSENGSGPMKILNFETLIIPLPPPVLKLIFFCVNRT